LFTPDENLSPRLANKSILDRFTLKIMRINKPSGVKTRFEIGDRVNHARFGRIESFIVKEITINARHAEPLFTKQTRKERVL
jgi:hypothetical protein